MKDLKLLLVNLVLALAVLCASAFFSFTITSLIIGSEVIKYEKNESEAQF